MIRGKRSYSWGKSGRILKYKVWCFQILKEDEKEETEAETQNFVLLGGKRQKSQGALCDQNKKQRCSM